jgi:cytochrome b involved in lipid metabolism
MWVAIHGRVFDLTEFYMEHPGGFDIIEGSAGQDATVKYEEGDHRMESIRDLT